MRNTQRPERTREHYIDALGRNHIERFVLLRGHTADVPRPDYGYDIVITTFNYKGAADCKCGEIENGSIHVQLKCTEDGQRRERPNLVSDQTPPFDLLNQRAVASHLDRLLRA